MILNKKYLTIYFLIFCCNYFFSQEIQDKTKEATNVEELEQVVVTGQHNPQSIKKSVFEVSVISRNQIDMQAGNNLADVLNQTLNINIIPNSSTGKSTVQMFGLSGEYFKILVDNIPLVNDEGLGNNTDLTQINLDDIKQIEIVEGSMGVQYGANAVAGVINIITKKNSDYKWKSSAYVQEETVGNEYAFFNEGRHIQSLSLGHKFTDNIYSNIIFTRNDFRGFFGDRQGPFHEFNDGLRGLLWLPKIQNTVKSILSYSGERDFKAFYKFEFFNEQVSSYSQLVTENYNGSTNTTNPVSNDALFSSERFVHHLNFSGNLKQQVYYDLSFSYQQQTRNVESFKYLIKYDKKEDVEDFEYESRHVLYTRGNFSNFLNNETIDFQLGYELNSTNGFASQQAGSFNGENIDRKLGNYDAFFSSEINLNKSFSLRPGTRLLTSSKFKPKAAISLISKYIFKNNLELRFHLGTAPKLPTYQELFTYFVDSNHDIRGNENLNPEQGASIFLHLKKRFSYRNTNDKSINIQSKLSLNYLDVKDRIELSVVNNLPLQFQYINIDTYKTIGAFFRNTLQSNNLKASLGIGYSGQSKVLDSEVVSNDDYLFSFQCNASGSYTFKNSGIVASALFKFNGPQQQFVQQTVNGETILERGEQDGFSMLDASIRKSFISDKLQLTLGARNLFNVTQVNTTSLAGGAHTEGDSTILLGYGRSYFLKLLYNLKFN